MVDVVTTDEFLEWYSGLDDADTRAVLYSVRILEGAGVQLGYPHSSQIKSSKALRELRVQSRGRPLRIFYAFDPHRDAVLLIGGCKEGLSDQRFYGEFVPKAEAIWETYLAEQVEGLHDDGHD